MTMDWITHDSEELCNLLARVYWGSTSNQKQQPMKPMRHPNKTPQGKDNEKSTECKYYKHSKPHGNCYSKMNHTLQWLQAGYTSNSVLVESKNKVDTATFALLIMK